jgi:hypothetical protein
MRSFLKFFMREPIGDLPLKSLGMPPLARICPTKPPKTTHLLAIGIPACIMFSGCGLPRGNGLRAGLLLSFPDSQR